MFGSPVCVSVAWGTCGASVAVWASTPAEAQRARYALRRSRKSVLVRSGAGDGGVGGGGWTFGCGTVGTVRRPYALAMPVGRGAGDTGSICVEWDRVRVRVGWAMPCAVAGCMRDAKSLRASARGRGMGTPAMRSVFGSVRGSAGEEGAGWGDAVGEGGVGLWGCGLHGVLVVGGVGVWVSCSETGSEDAGGDGGVEDERDWPRGSWH